MIGTGISFNIAALIRLSSGSQCGNLTQSGPEGAHFVRYVGSKHQLAPDTELVEREKAVILRGRVLDRRCSPVPGASGTLAIQGDTVCHPEGQESASTLEGEVNFCFWLLRWRCCNKPPSVKRELCGAFSNRQRGRRQKMVM